MFISAVYAFLFIYFDIQGAESNMYDGVTDSATGKMLGDQFIKCQSIINVISLPFLSLTTWIFFGPAKMYYGEHLLLNAYLTGFSLFFGILLFPISLVHNSTWWVDANDYLVMLLVFIWCTRTYYGLFYSTSTLNLLFALLKTIAIIVLLAIWQYITSPFVITLKLLIFGD